MAFHLVERILEIEGRERARGSFRVPASGPPLSPSLLAEAVGQLASWVAMAHVDFAARPVAGLAGEVRTLGVPSLGARLDLVVEISRLDDTAIAYGGAASQGEETLLEMRGCVGPMMPTAEFDDPEALRARFERLRRGKGGADFDTAPDPVALEMLDAGRPGKARARIRVPAAAPLFADHFPRRPVFPGTLLLDAEVRLADHLARVSAPTLAGVTLRPNARGVKFRAFLVPGDRVEITAELDRADETGARVRVAAERDGQRVGNARIELTRP